MPQAAAVSAPSGSARSANALARGSPRLRASDQLPPASGTRPILEKGWMNLAERPASTMSHARPIFAPAPAATPSIAQMIGFLIDRMNRSVGLKKVSRTCPRSGGASPLRGSCSSRSAPAQKPRPGAGQQRGPNRRIVRHALKARAQGNGQGNTAQDRLRAMAEREVSGADHAGIRAGRTVSASQSTASRSSIAAGGRSSQVLARG